MGVEAAIGVDTGVEQQADVVAVGQNSVNEGPAKLAEFFLALRIPEKVRAIRGNGNVGVHAAAVDADDRLGKETCGESHFVGDLAADELVELDLIGSGDDFAVAVVDFELRGRDFRVIFFILEAHGALHFGAGVDKGAQRIAGERVVVAAGVDVLELSGFVVMALGVGALEEEAFDFVGGVEGVALFFVQRFGIALEQAANVGAVGRAILINDFAEHENFAVAEIIGGGPV